LIEINLPNLHHTGKCHHNGGKIIFGYESKKVLRFQHSAAWWHNDYYTKLHNTQTFTKDQLIWYK